MGTCQCQCLHFLRLILTVMLLNPNGLILILLKFRNSNVISPSLFASRTRFWFLLMGGFERTNEVSVCVGLGAGETKLPTKNKSEIPEFALLGPNLMLDQES